MLGMYKHKAYSIVIIIIAVFLEIAAWEVRGQGCRHTSGCAGPAQHD